MSPTTDWAQSHTIMSVSAADRAVTIEYNGQVMKLDRLAALELQKMLAEYDAYGDVAPEAPATAG